MSFIERDGSNNIVGRYHVEQPFATEWLDDTDAELALIDLRASKIAEIKDRRDSEIALRHGVTVAAVKLLYLNTDPAFHSPELMLSYDTWVYAAGKINRAKTATKAQLEAYDVAADAGWPV